MYWCLKDVSKCKPTTHCLPSRCRITPLMEVLFMELLLFMWWLLFISLFLVNVAVFSSPLWQDSAVQIMLINLAETCTDLSEADCSFYCHPRLAQSKTTLKKLLVCFGSGAFKEAALHQTFTPHFDSLWSIAIQFFVAIHLFECFPAQWPILHSPPVLQFALSITLLSMLPHTLILASLHLAGSHCRIRRLLVSSFTGFFFFHRRSWNWASAHLWESLFCVRLTYSICWGSFAWRISCVKYLWNLWIIVFDRYIAISVHLQSHFFFISKQQTCQENWLNHTL